MSGGRCREHTLCIDSSFSTVPTKWSLLFADLGTHFMWLGSLKLAIYHGYIHKNLIYILTFRN